MTTKPSDPDDSPRIVDSRDILGADDSPLLVEISEETGDWDIDASTMVRAAAKAAFDAVGGVDAEVSVLLTDDARVRTLNREYRSKDRPTNVLSFPAGPESADQETGRRFLGDLVLACETIRGEAEAQKKPFAHHLQHLVVHGMLHLFGHDHEEESAAEEMEELEREILAGFGIPDPYAGRDTASQEAS